MVVKKKYENIKDLAFKSLNRVDSALNFAEAKIGFLITFVSILIGLLADHFKTLHQILVSNHCLNRIVVITSIALMTIGLVIVLVASLIGIFPRLSVTKTKSFFFFSSINELDEDNFIAEFKSLDKEKAIEHALSQLHAVSKIANRKFICVKFAVFGAIMVFVGWLTAVIEIFIVG